MTSSRSRQAAPGPWRVPALLVACLLPVLAACSGAAAQVQLPAKPRAATPPAASKPAALTPRQQAVAALAAYTTALSQAARSGSEAEARQLLRPYLAASRLGGLVQAVSAIWAKGDVFYGQDVLHILTVRMDGQQAFVHDCDNTSGMGLEDGVTGQTVPGSAGVAHENVVTRLDLVAGRWLVESQLPEDVPCAP